MGSVSQYPNPYSGLQTFAGSFITRCSKTKVHQPLEVCVYLTVIRWHYLVDLVSVHGVSCEWYIACCASKLARVNTLDSRHVHSPSSRGANIGTLEQIMKPQIGNHFQPATYAHIQWGFQRQSGIGGD